MDYKNIKLKEINYKYNVMKYKQEKIAILTPIMKCYSGVEKFFNKYEIKLEFPLDTKEGKKFYEFMQALEENNKAHMNHLAEYKGQMYKIGEKIILVLKIPYRYNNFEVEVKSESKFLPTIFEVRENNRVKCEIDIEKLWYFSKNGKLLCGCLMEVKKIIIID